MSVFALRQIDLTKIELRPLVGKLWEYYFYIDFTGSTNEPVVQRALANLQEYTTFFRILGSYPRHRPGDELKARERQAMGEFRFPNRLPMGHGDRCPPGGRTKRE